MLVFISYPREFEPVAVALDTELKCRNIATFIDKESIDVTEVWRLQIESNIRKAGVFVVLYRPEAATRDRFFRTETERIQKACENNPLQRLITVVFPPTTPWDLPPFFRNHQILVSETTGILEDERDSYWIDQIVRKVESNLVQSEANPRRQIRSITTLTLLAGSIALIALFPIYKMLFSGATIPPNRMDLPAGNLFNDPPKTSFPTDQKQEDYKVVLGADANLKLPGVPGELRVWIGSPHVNPNLPDHMAQAGIILPAVGETAKITPFAPAFEIEPKESVCMAIHPTGSVSRFKLMPTKIGTFNVGADVQLFNAPECRGAPIPKWTDTLQVTVVVNSDEALQERTKQLGEIFWEKLKEFWGLSIALFFALLLFLIKKRLKKWFSFGNDK